MAEICLDCWNKINNTNDTESKYILSEHLDLCEDCGEYKHVIIMERKAYYMHKFSYFILPFGIIFFAIHLIWKLLTLPYLIFRHKKTKTKNKNN